MLEEVRTDWKRKYSEYVHVCRYNLEFSVWEVLCNGCVCMSLHLNVHCDRNFLNTTVELVNRGHVWVLLLCLAERLFLVRDKKKKVE